MPISSALGSSALLPAGLGHRNKIINGDMRIAQRGTATITGSGSAQYPVDRWAVFNGTDGNNVTFVRDTDAPAGFTNSLLATVSNAAGSYSSSGYTQITHKIEGFNCQDLAYGTASAKPIILSFWVKSSVVGTQNVSFKNSGNNRVYIAKYTINVANTWEQKIISIVGDTTGTWLVDSGIGLEVTFNLGMGTGYDSTAGAWYAAAARYSTSDAIDFAATANATFRVTGVQLEQNIQPTPFEQRPIGTELALCQRYCWQSNYAQTAVYGMIALGFMRSAAIGDFYMCMPVELRTTATDIVISASALLMISDGLASYGSGAWTITLQTTESTPRWTAFSAANTSGMTAYRPCRFMTQNNASGFVRITAEL